MISSATAFASWVVSLLLASPGPAPDPQAEFAKGLEQCQKLLSHSQWKDAKALLATLLQQHEGKDYVRVKRAEILEDLKRCEFRLRYRSPDPATLIKGKLLAWNASTGEIRLSYTKETLADFTVTRGGGGSEIFIHPVQFRGPCSIEVKGPKYAAGASNWGRSSLPVILACIQDDKLHQVVFGLAPVVEDNVTRSAPAVIECLPNEGGDPAASKSPSPVKGEAPFSLKVAVTKGEVAAFYGGEKILSARKPASLFGRVGFMDLPPFTELLIKGEAETSWIQGLVDAASTSARQEFEKTYDPVKDLPAWLQADAPAPAAEASHPAESAVPGTLTAEQTSRVGEALDLLAKEKYSKGFVLVNGWKEGTVPEETRAFLLASFDYALDQPDDALPLCDRVRKLAPDFVEGRRLRALVLAELRRRKEAIEEYRSLLAEQQPTAPDYVALAVLLLREGRPDEAKEVVDRAIGAKIRGKDLESIQALLVKALKGPSWSKSFEYESRNFRIASDMDRNTCIEASRILEESYLAYTYRLRKIPDLDKRKFRVYLFSGQASYEAYAQDTGIGTPAHTAGLYTPVLKQLLIWNLPDRDSMMHTVRHEGFHQYLDRLMDDPPTWFNEGLAEYYERAAMQGGTWVQGRPHPENLAILRSPEGTSQIVELKSLLAMGPKQFYGGNTALNYATAWAFIQFLRHSTKENEQLFDKLFDSLAANTDSQAALVRTFGGVNLGQMQRDLEAYVLAMKDR